MDRWAPIFNKIVESSIWDEDDSVCKVFVTMLAIKDADHVVRKTLYQIARACRKTEAEVMRCLEVLSSPDRKRLEPQPHEGRRISKVEDGWLILNGQAYENLMRKVSRQVYQARWARERRNANAGKGKPLPGERAYEEALRSGDDKRAQDILDGQASSAAESGLT